MSVNGNHSSKAAVQFAAAIVSTVAEVAPQGAPAGILYAACMAHGISLDQFERLMSVLVSNKVLVKSGYLYTIHPNMLSPTNASR